MSRTALWLLLRLDLLRGTSNSSFYLCYQVSALSKQSMKACHSVSRQLNFFISNFHNLARILTFKASPDWGFKLSFPDEELGFEVIGEFICRDFRVESMRTKAHVILSLISLTSVTSYLMDSSSFSSSTSSKIFSSRLFKVLSFSLSIIFCWESLSCNDDSKLVIESSTWARSFLTCARWPLRIFLYFLSTSGIIVPKSDSEGPCKEFIVFRRTTTG